MNHTAEFLMSMSIIFPSIIAIVRWKKMDSSFYPFVYNLLVTLLVEILIGFQRSYIITTKITNVFSLVDFCLFAWLFHNWGLFNYNKKRFYVILGSFFLIWIYITFFFSGFSNINNLFLLIYSFALIFFSVTTFNKIVVQQRINIFVNARFWICIGIIIFYSFFIVTRATDLSTTSIKDISNALNNKSSFKDDLQKINAYSNILVNLLYAVAVIWIPRQKNTTTLF
jgi:hypothetical protein